MSKFLDFFSYTKLKNYQLYIKRLNITQKQLYILNLFYSQTHNNPLNIFYNNFIGRRNNLYIFNILEAFYILRRILFFFYGIYKRNGLILLCYDDLYNWNVLQQILKNYPIPFINNKWINGTLSNFKNVYEQITTRLLFYSSHPKFSNLIYINKKVNYLFNYYYNLKYVKQVPSAVFILSTSRLLNCINEASNIDIPSIGGINTLNHKMLDYNLPLNDSTKLSTIYYSSVLKNIYYGSVYKKYLFLNKILNKNLSTSFKRFNLGIYIKNHLLKLNYYNLIRKHQILKYSIYNNNKLINNQNYFSMFNIKKGFKLRVLTEQEEDVEYAIFDSNSSKLTNSFDILLNEKNEYYRLFLNKKFIKFRKYLINFLFKNKISKNKELFINRTDQFKMNLLEALRGFKFIIFNKNKLNKFYLFLLKIALLDSFLFFYLCFIIYHYINNNNIINIYTLIKKLNNIQNILFFVNISLQLYKGK